MLLFQIFLIFGIVLNNTAYTQQEEVCKEKIEFSLDERSWKVGHHQDASTESITEFVLDNEDIYQWKELVTIHRWKGLPISMQDFVENFIKTLKQNNEEKGTFSSKTLSEKNNDILIEWSLTNGNSDNQYELLRAIKNDPWLYFVRYTTRKVDGIDVSREKWVPILSKAALKPANDQTPSVYWIDCRGVFKGTEKLKTTAVP